MTSRLRWFVKKAARGAVAWAAWAGGATATGPGTPAEPRLRVLTYHGFGDSRRDPFCVSQTDFHAQMAYLKQYELAVSLEAVEEFVAGRRNLAPGSVLVTIDDGLRSVHRIAMPVLQQIGVPAVAYVTSDLVASTEDIGIGRAPSATYMNWGELRELQQAGIRIGSHALSHRSLGRLALAEVRSEAAGSRRALEDRLGQEIASFAYPYGTRADFSLQVASILAECGYRLAFTSQHGFIRPGMNALLLPRIKVEGGESLRMFRLLVRGGMDAWQWVDRSLWRFQAAKAGA